MTDQHPTYPHPTIVEVVCEIHFSLPEAQPWKATFAGDLFKKIQNDYPEMEPIATMNMHVEFTPQGMQQQVLPPQQKMRFTHKSGTMLLQFSEGLVTINVLAPYPGWEAVSKVVLDAWRKVRALVHPTTIDRLGLRYINRIDRESADQPANTWLQATDYIPTAALQTAHTFLVRVQVQPTAEDSIIMTLGEVNAEPQAEINPIIFDIDRIMERPLHPEGKQVATELTRLHEDIWRIFAAARTDRLIQRLEGERHEHKGSD